MTSEQIVAALTAHYQGWLAIPELRIGTGYGKDAEPRIDFWAMEMLPSKAFRRIAYEIKVSRDDFTKELRKPLKKRPALLLSNEFYFIAPPDIIRPDELPVECGLAEVYPTGYIQNVHPAPWRDSHPPTWRFLAAVARRCARME